MSETLFPSTSGRGILDRRPRGRWPRRVLRAVAVLLIAGGGLALIDGIVTIAWQEPVSALYASIRQDNLSGALRTVEQAPPTPLEQRTLASLSDQQERITFLAKELERSSREGSAIGRISIPSIGVSFVIVKGTKTADLMSGPGVYGETPFPGTPGTTAIAGHRTTYLAPFRHVDALHRGNRILVHMPYAYLTYKVIGLRVVEPTDVQAAVANVGYTRLVLSACTPLYSAAKRLLVYARLERAMPIGAARRLPGGVLARPIESSPSRPPVSPVLQRSLPAVLEPLQPHLLPPFSQ